ncbi:MAG: DNA methyltransferase [Nitrospirota bacterium]
MTIKYLTTEHQREERGNPFSFAVRETAAKYHPPLEPYFYDKDHSIKLFHGDCIEILNNHVPASCVDVIFADPPYFLSNGGITCHAGKMVSVNKGKWDESKGVAENHAFNLTWLQACQRVLKTVYR